jgi:hypothetical protein
MRRCACAVAARLATEDPRLRNTQYGKRVVQTVAAVITRPHPEYP